MQGALREELKKDERVRWAYVFGSFARREPFRDIDVAVMSAPESSWSALELGRLCLRLEHATGRSVDVIDLRRTSLPLLGSILRDRVVLVDRDPDERHAWEATTASRWFDFEPAFSRCSAVRREALRRRQGVGG